MPETFLRILGPVRAKSQIELSLPDAILLGVDVPIVVSGNLERVKSFMEVKAINAIRCLLLQVGAIRNANIAGEQTKSFKV